MAATGMFNVEDRRPVNEARIKARAKLGRLLEKIERGAGPGRGKKNAQAGQSFIDYLKKHGIERKRADEVQRIAAIPDHVLANRFAETASRGELTYIVTALEWSRPFCCLHSGPHARLTEFGVVAQFKLMLWFVKGTRSDKHTFINNVVSGQREKNHHEWQQAEAEAAYFIENLSPPSGFVVDFFLPEAAQRSLPRND
jgi:hypothetical protein